MNAWVVLGVPIDCSGRDIGVERLPAALRAAGLVDRIAARDLGDIPVRIGNPRRDPATGLIDFPAVCAASLLVREAVRGLLGQPRRPLILGGCCTLLIGVCAALKQQFGSCGLAFVDGHLDFYDGTTSPTGEAADMDLAIACGIGPRGLIDLAGPPPLTDPSHIAVLGFRDEEEAARHHAPDPRTRCPEMDLVEVAVLRRRGPEKTGRGVARRFAREPGRFWLHFDLDVLDQDVMPAVDYRMPGGLTWLETEALLRPLIQSPALVGMDVTILNPTLDPGGEHTCRTVDFLAGLLRTGGTPPRRRARGGF